jgi:hypothetical protein
MDWSGVAAAAIRRSSPSFRRGLHAYKSGERPLRPTPTTTPSIGLAHSTSLLDQTTCGLPPSTKQDPGHRPTFLSGCGSRGPSPPGHPGRRCGVFAWRDAPGLEAVPRRLVGTTTRSAEVVRCRWSSALPDLVTVGASRTVVSPPRGCRLS